MLLEKGRFHPTTPLHAWLDTWTPDERGQRQSIPSCSSRADLCFLFTITTESSFYSHSIMVTGIEVVGLTLAIFPLLVNQIDAYARSIERIRLWRRWSSEFKQYSIKLGSQHAIFLNTLEDVLKDVVDNKEEVTHLISSPQGDRWQSRILQERLCTKLGRSFKPFLGMMNRISELLGRASSRINIECTDDFIAKVRRDYVSYVAIKLTRR